MCKENSIKTVVHFTKSLAFCYILKILRCQGVTLKYFWFNKYMYLCLYNWLRITIYYHKFWKLHRVTCLNNDKFKKNVNKTRIKTDIFSIIFILWQKIKKSIRNFYPQNLSAKSIRKIYPQNLSAKFIRKIYPQFLSAKFTRKIYPQNLSAKFIRKIYPQNLSAIFIRKIYPQNLSAKSIRKIYPQNLSAKFIRKIYPQSAIRTRIFHQTVQFN